MSSAVQRWLRRVLRAVIVLVCVVAPALAQCATWSPEFAVSTANGPVYALLVHVEGGREVLYAGGDFTAIGDCWTGRVARFDGERWTPLGDGLWGGEVFALAFYDDGNGVEELYAGGYFTSSASSGVSLNHVARFDGTTWRAVGAGFDSSVRALQVYDDGGGPRLYAGGNFSSSGGSTCRILARWNFGAWQPMPGITWQSTTIVDGLAVLDDGAGPALYFSGSYTGTHANGFVVGLMRYGPTGFSWPAGLNATGRIFGTFDDGSGTALYFRGSVLGAENRKLLRWNGTAWSAPDVGLLAIPLAITAHDDGSGPRLVASVNPSASSVRLQQQIGGVWTNSPVQLSIAPSALASYLRAGNPARELVAGGPLAPGSGLSGSSLVSFDGTNWNEFGAGAGALGVVHALAVHDDGSGPALYAGGSFRRIGDVETGAIACWRNGAWHAVGSGFTHQFASSLFVQELFSWTDSSGTARLLASGSFDHAGTTPLNSIAAWDGSAWTQFGPNAGTWMNSFCVYDSGAGPELYAAGSFVLWPGPPVISNLGRWTGSTWDVVGANPDGEVTSLAVFDDGLGGGAQLYAAGKFQHFGGQSINRIARWNGAQWSALAPGLIHDIYALCVFDDGSGPRLFAGGFFQFVGGVNALRIAAWDGVQWTPVGGGMNGTVYALAVHDAGSGPALYAAGAFTQAGGISAPGVAKWNGTQWEGLGGGVAGAGLASAPRALDLVGFDDGSGNGRDLWVGGDFSRAGSSTSAGIARWEGCAAREFCAGDGLDAAVTIACPCGNVGAAGRGCANSADARGARLTTSGTIDPDTLRLEGTGMPQTSFALFLKGDANQSGGVVFGDGILCVDGALIRLRTKQNAGGASSFPESGDPTLSLRGQTPPGSALTAYYQLYYRNAAAYCTLATFNVSNGVRVVW